MKIVWQHTKGELLQRIRAIQRPMADAASKAVRQAGELALANGRQNIAAAGFSSRWQKGLVAEFYPDGKPSMKPLAVIRHKIGYSGVFEQGATITGDPYLWLPLPAAPTRGRRQMTPKQYVASGGRLASFNRSGRAPLLIDATSRIVRPLFIGIRAVAIRRRFRIAEIVREAAARLADFYADAVNRSRAQSE